MGVFNLFKGKKKEEDKPSSKFINDEWVEVTASSKEAAIERACIALNTNESHLEIKILSKDGKKLQARKTEITEENEKPVAPRRDGRGNRGSSRPNRGQGQGQGQQQQRSSRGRNNPNQRMDSRNDQRIDEEQTDENRFNRRDERDNRGGEREDNNDEQQQDSYNSRSRRPSSDEYEYSSNERNSNNDSFEDDFEEEIEEETDLGRKARDVLTQIVQVIEAESKVELYETNKTIRLEIISAESGLFIGKFGQTLDSIQHLMKKMLELKNEESKHLVVDAEDYRIRREESIETKARKLAKKARQERRPVSIEPMSAMDRRIVHMALKGEPGIETKSIGEGSNRRVLIVPKRVGGGRGREEGGRGRQASGRNGNRGGRGGRQPNRGRNEQSGNSQSRMHDSYDVPNLPKSEVFGDNPEEYFEQHNFDDEK